MIRAIVFFLVALAACVLAADQAPDVANALVMQFRPETNFQSCTSSPNDQTNCGFCYGVGGTFLGWNCNCNAFCSGTKNSCYYILQSNPSTYSAVTCV